MPRTFTLRDFEENVVKTYEGFSPIVTFESEHVVIVLDEDTFHLYTVDDPKKVGSLLEYLFYYGSNHLKILGAYTREPEGAFTIEEIRNYIKSQDSLGDVAYNLSEANIRKANGL